MTKKKRGIMMVVSIIAMFIAGASLGTFYYLSDRCGVESFLKKDISASNDQDLAADIRRMRLAEASAQQRRAVFDKLYRRVKSMNMQEQLAFINMGRRAMKNEAGTSMGKNIELLVLEFWGRKSREYMGMTPEERKAEIDKQIAREQAMEAARRTKQLANKLLGKPMESADSRATRHAGEIIQGASNALKSGNTSDRAAAAQFYTDLQQRRSELGLPAAF